MDNRWAEGHSPRWQVRTEGAGAAGGAPLWDDSSAPSSGWATAVEDDPGGADGGGQRRWWVALLSAAVLMGLGALMLRSTLDARGERERLLVAAKAVVLAEAKAQALQDAAAGEAFLDPEAPRDWAARYRRLYAYAPVNPFNELCGVYGSEWQPGAGKVDVVLESVLADRPQTGTGGSRGRRIVARVQWLEGSRATERRAYREVDGRWRRTPLLGLDALDGPEREVAVGGVLVRGPAADVADLTADPVLALDFAVLEARVRADLSFVPQTGPGSPRTTVVVRPVELEGPVIEVGVAPERLVVVNAPRLALVNPHGPLTAAALYRLAVARGVLAAQFRQFGVQELPFVPNWSLTAAEQRALRNRLRVALDGEWRSQLSRSGDPGEAVRLRYGEYEEWQRRCLSDALLVQQLVITGRVASFGELIERFEDDNAESAAALLQELSGQPSVEAYEAWARAWAMEPE